MNKQGPNGIEYVHYTLNPIGGCFHNCRWVMPDGNIAICYAERIAEGLASSAYPEGWQHYYWRPRLLTEPEGAAPSRIFVGSMADVFGHWVEDDHICQILDMCKAYPWHDFLFLTKNAPRLRSYADDFPPNAWLGVSMPATFMNHGQKSIKTKAQARYMNKALDVLAMMPQGNITWLSLEPLSFDVAEILWQHEFSPSWMVIGAASHGITTYQPIREHVHNVLDYAGTRHIPVFFKNNLKWEPRRMEMPHGKR